MDTKEITMRLGASLVIGMLIGLDRNLHGKPTGVRTLGLVCLGAAVMTLGCVGLLDPQGRPDANSLSRVIQGLVTGIGFLGAGVIVHDAGTGRVRGLTTAASIWVTSILGILCGIGSWQLAGIALALVFLLLLAGKPLEQALHRRWLGKPAEERDALALHDE